MQKLNNFLKNKQYIIKKIIPEIEYQYEHFAELKSRYLIESSMVVFLTTEDIKENLIKDKRKLDLLVEIKCKEGVSLSFLFLTHTSVENSYNFIKKIEHNFLLNEKHKVVSKEVIPTTHLNGKLNELLLELEES